MAHPVGVWMTSKMKRLLRPYWFLEDTWTEKRPVDALGTLSAVTEVSTRRKADEEEAYVRFKLSACAEGT